MIAGGAHTVTPRSKLLAAVFCKMLRAAWMPKATLVHWRQHQIVFHVVRNMFLYARCCPQLIKAPLSQSTWPIHSPSQSMWHQKSFVSSNTQGESGSCYIPDNQRIGKIFMKNSQSLVDNNVLSASWQKTDEMTVVHWLSSCEQHLIPNPMIKSSTFLTISYYKQRA